MYTTPPPFSPFSITDCKDQVSHKHCRSTEGQTRVEKFLDLCYTKMYIYKRISETKSNSMSLKDENKKWKVMP